MFFMNVTLGLHLLGIFRLSEDEQWILSFLTTMPAIDGDSTLALRRDYPPDCKAIFHLKAALRDGEYVFNYGFDTSGIAAGIQRPKSQTADNQRLRTPSANHP